MITIQRTIDIQFGDYTVGLGNSNGRLTLTGLTKPAMEGVNVNDLVDFFQPAVCLHFPTADSVNPILKQLQEIQDRLKKRELALELREALDRELELAAREEYPDDYPEHEDGCGCGMVHTDLSSITEDEII